MYFTSLTHWFVIFIVLFSFGKCWERGALEKFGPFQLALHSNLIKCNHDKTLNLDVSDIDVHFYDFSKLDHEQYRIDNAANGILNKQGLDKNKRFIIYVPGFKSNINKDGVEKVRDAFIGVPNIYLIIFDHSTYTNNNQGSLKSYERSVKYVYYIGEAVGIFMANLSRGGVSPKQIHGLGHSLGSQIFGYAGGIFTNVIGSKISRITALDPAGPCFSKSLIEDQIRSGCADYVEVFHCNSGGLGTTSVLGDIDFFVNLKGQFQPNCKAPLIPGVFDSSKAAKCSHKTCILLYIATIKHPDWFPARKCDSYKSFKHDSCPINDATIAGFWSPGNATGVYYFSTEGYQIDE